MKEKREKIYIGIIIALLIFIFYSRSLHSGDLQRMENTLHHFQRQTSGEIARIEQQVGQIREEGRWWSEKNMALDRKGENLHQVTAEWRIRDYREGEQVLFHYLPVGEEEYRQVEMEEVSTGLFRGVFDLEMSFEPEIRMHYSGSMPTNRYNEVEVWAGQEEGRRDYLPHYVSTKYNGERRTTPEERMHFSDLRYELFHPIHIDIHYRGGNEPQYHLSIDVDLYQQSSRHHLEALEAVLLKDGQAVRELEMQYQDTSYHQHYHKNFPVDEEAYDEVLFRFAYDNGEVYEKRAGILDQQ